MLKRVALGALIALAVCAALPQLWYPYGFDQMVYAACGDAIRRGGVPIRDCFETKQMGVMVMYSIPMRFTLAPMAVHAFALLWQAATSIAVGVVARRMFGGAWPAWAAGMLYWLMYAGINYWSMGQAETFSNVLLLAACYLLWRAGPSNEPVQSLPKIAGRKITTDMALAGVCIGVAFWFKYVFAVVGLALGAVWLARMLLRRAPIAQTFGAAMAYGGGVFAAIALVLAYYAINPGGIEALIQQLNFLRENFPLAEPLPLPGMLQQMLRFFDNGADVSGGYKATLGEALAQANVLGGGFPLAIGLAALGAVRHVRGNAYAVALLLAYLAACVLVVIWQGNYIQYHYTLLHVPVALLAGAALASWQGAWARVGMALSRGALLCAVGLLIWRVTPLIRDAWQNVLVERKPVKQMYLESRQGAHIAVSDFLREKTRPDETISIFGDAPWIYTLSERRNATRHSFVNVWIKKRGTPSYALFSQQWVDDMQRNQPVYVVLARENFPWPNNSTPDDYKANPVIFPYVEANYRYEGENGPFLLFRRKD